MGGVDGEEDEDNVRDRFNERRRRRRLERLLHRGRNDGEETTGAAAATAARRGGDRRRRGSTGLAGAPSATSSCLGTSCHSIQLFQKCDFGRRWLTTR